ncbi:MAG: glycosyltransferase family 39 protein [Phycisphaerae bacterium]|nr:glycosyltransferase family 39 protein [Phycisphaerae bacterium]
MPPAAAPDILASHVPSDARPLTLAERLVVAASVALVWVLAWGHPLYPPDEGRYGSVAATMADGGSLGAWIVPFFRGEPHLTKPPLIYWLQALGVEVFGRTAFAVRLPSLLATSAALLVLFAWMRRGFGTRPAVLSVALAAVMPLTLIVGRLATTDALLSLAWIAMLASAWTAIGAPTAPPRARSLAVVAFWCAFAVGLLTKGPAAIGPLGIVTVWLLLAGRGRDVARLRPFVGLPLALLPLVAWIVALALDPRTPLGEAGSLWWKETFGRALGSANLRPEPFWYYLVVVAAGAFPATTFLALPLYNLRLGATVAAFRAGDLRALLLVAAILPMLAFSVSVGKLATYMLPVMAPIAALAALTLEGWLRGTFDAPVDGYRPPEVRRTFAIVATLIFATELGLAIYVFDRAPDLLGVAIPLAIAPIGAWILVGLWRRGLRLRGQGLAVAWVAMALAWTLRFGIETRFLAPMGAPALLERVRDLFGTDKVRVATIGFDDPTIAFYNDGRVTFEDVDPAHLLEWGSIDETLVVLVPVARVEALIDEHPEVTRRLEPVATWQRFFAHPTRVFVLRAAHPRGPHVATP